MMKLSVGIWAGSLLLLSSHAFAVNDKALDILKKGYEECKSAHLLRRQDFEQAREIYNAYIDLRAQAVAIDAAVLESEDADVTRIINYCDTVGVDISRTEALPVFKNGVAACGRAAEHIRNREVEEAEKEYQHYMEQRAEAEQISAAITDVFSVKTEIRRCDRVKSEIEAVIAEVATLEAQLKENHEYLTETLSLCQLMTGKELEGLDLDQMELRMSEFKAHQDANPHQGLFEQEGIDKLLPTNGIKVLEKKISACEVTAQANIKAEKAALIAAEEERKRQEELARQEQQRLAGQGQNGAAGEGDESGSVQEESEEEKQERMARNFAYYTLVKRVNPEFPSRALRTGREGYVVIEYNVNPDGKVINATVVESSPKHLFEKAALKAIKKWQYEANFDDAEPDMALARTRMSFSLSN